MFVGIEKFIEEKQCVKGKKDKPVNVEGNLTAFPKEGGFDENGCLKRFSGKAIYKPFFCFGEVTLEN